MIAAGHLDPGQPMPMPTPVTAAELAAESLRNVNRLTISAPSNGVPGWEGVGDLYGVLGELRVLLERLPQALGQLARHLERPEDGVVYRCDASTDESVEVLVAAAVVALDAAQRGADEITRYLAEAQNRVGHIGIR